MAIAELDVVINGLSEGIKDLNKLQKAGNDTTNSLLSGFKALGATAAAAFAGFTLKEIINSASEAEKEVTKLNSTLKLSGSFTKEASQDFIDYASSVEEATNTSDEQVLSLVSQAKALGISNSETKKLIDASMDLSAVTGDDVNTAFDQLSKTLAGNAGRLKQQFPELKQLTTEQLANGEAVRILGERYRGVAAEIRNTFGGAATALIVSIGNVAESIGGLIVQNPVIVEGLNRLADLFNSIARAIAESTPAIIDFINTGLIRLTAAISENLDQNAEFISTLVEIGRTIKDLLTPFILSIVDNFFDFNQATNALSATLNSLYNKAIKPLLVGFQILGVGALTATQQISNAFGGSEKFSNDLQKSIDNIVDSTFRLVDGNEEGVKSVKEVNKATKDYVTTLLSTQKAESALTNSKIDAEKQKRAAIEETIRQQKVAIQTAQQAAVQAGVSNPFQALTGNNQQQINNVRKTEGATDADAQLAASQAKIGAIAGLVNQTAQGFQGAVNLASQLAGTIADTLLPGIGGAVGQLISFLAQGPDKVRETITAFFNAIPQIIENIILAVVEIGKILPEIIIDAINTIIEMLPDIIVALVEAAITQFPRVVDAIIDALPRFIQALVSATPKIVEGFIKSFSQNIPALVGEIGKGIVDAIKGAIGLGGDGGGIIGGIGKGVSNIVGGVGDFLGFQEGGRIPDLAAFRNDGAFTKVDGGEQIFSKDLSGKMEAFLNTQSGNGRPQQLTIINQLGEREVSRFLVDLDQKGFRTA